MTIRAFALLFAFEAALPSALGAQQGRACGVERWPVKIAADVDAGRVDTVAERTTVSQLASLPRPAEMPQSGRPSRYERTTWVVIARVVRMFREEDSDWHLVLQDTAPPFATIIAELP